MNLKNYLVGASATVALLLGGLTMGAGSASAAPVPSEDQAYVKSTSAQVQKGYTSFNVFLAGGAAGETTATLTVYGCHGEVLPAQRVNPNTDPLDAVFQSPYTYTAPNDPESVSIYWHDHSYPVQPLTYTVTIQTQGYDAYTLSGAYNATNAKCPAQSQQQPKAPLVKKWGHKVKKHAKQHHTVTVSKVSTVAGARVQYRWIVGGKIVKQHAGQTAKARKLILKHKWLHKKVVLKVSVTKGGYAAKSHTFRFGKVHR